MKHVILDTNIVLAPFTLKIDIYSKIEQICPFEHKLITFEGVLDELDSIYEQGGQTGKAAKAAKQLLIQKRDNREITVLPMSIKHTNASYVDDEIVAYAQSHDCIVATQDKELKARLQTPIIVIRQKNHVELQN